MAAETLKAFLFSVIIISSSIFSDTTRLFVWAWTTNDKYELLYGYRKTELPFNKQ